MKKTLFISTALGLVLLVAIVIGVWKSGWAFSGISPIASTPSLVTPAPSLATTSSKAQQFILLADTGAATTSQFTVAEAIQQHCAQADECTAVFIAGDIIYENGVKTITDPQFQTKFEQPYQNIDLPFYIAYGNHDYLGCKACYLDYASKSKKWRMPSSFYVQDFGKDIAFFVIDTEHFSEQQQQWLREALSSSTAQHKIVVGHRPIKTFEVTKVGENWNGKKELAEIICHQADLYVAGHAHILEDNGQIDDCSVRQLVVGGGGANLRTVSPKSDGAFSAAKHGFVILTTKGQDVSYTFFDEQGNKLFESSLQ